MTTVDLPFNTLVNQAPVMQDIGVSTILTAQETHATSRKSLCLRCLQTYNKG